MTLSSRFLLYPGILRRCMFPEATTRKSYQMYHGDFMSPRRSRRNPPTLLLTQFLRTKSSGWVASARGRFVSPLKPKEDIETIRRSLPTVTHLPQEEEEKEEETKHQKQNTILSKKQQNISHQKIDSTRKIMKIPTTSTHTMKAALSRNKFHNNTTPTSTNMIKEEEEDDNDEDDDDDEEEETNVSQRQTSVDTRFKAKLIVLANAKLKAHSSSKLYHSALEQYEKETVQHSHGVQIPHSHFLEAQEDSHVSTSSTLLPPTLHKYDSTTLESLRKQHVQHEMELSYAYSQAIKYLAKSREKDSASRSQGLLFEMIRKLNFVPASFFHSKKEKIQEQEEREEEEENGIDDEEEEEIESEKYVRNVNAKEKHKVPTKNPIPKKIQNPSPIHTLLQELFSSSSLQKQETHINSIIHDDTIPYPTKKDFHNVLHAWASSKAKRKGLMAEDLLLKMIQLTQLAKQKDPNHPYSRYLLMPDSKTFALVVKCYAGSTYHLAWRHVLKLHDIHSLLVQHQIPGIIPDDPFLLLHSIKAVKNYKKRNETKQLLDWFHRLHDFVLNPTNNNDSYSKNIPSTSSSSSFSMQSLTEDEDSTENARNHQDSSSSSEQNTLHTTRNQIDLTGTYSLMIRRYSQLRGEPGVANQCHVILEKMQEIKDFENTLSKEGRTSISTVDIRLNSYNMVLGAFCDSKDEKYLSLALSYLNKMIHAWKGQKQALSSVPIPNEQSFVYCFGSLKSSKNVKLVMHETERLLKQYESMYTDGTVPFIPTPKVYNSCMEVYTNVDEKEALSACMSLVDRMKEKSKQYPGVMPNVDTWTLVIKACSLVTGDIFDTTRALETAHEIFEQMKRTDSPKPTINDATIFFMMKCAVHLISDPNDRQMKVIQLFEEACKNGMLSANVLRVFQNNVPKNVFTERVGNGRLADKWIANVTSGAKALYTDGTVGGEEKNARRKGKSTSNWLKKQRDREAAIVLKKEGKISAKGSRKVRKNRL